MKLALTLLIVVGTQSVFAQLTAESLDLSKSVIPCDSIKDAKGTIRMVLTQQIRDKAPNTVEVTDEYLAWTKEKVSKGSVFNPIPMHGRTTINNAYTSYYSSITDLDVVSKKSHYEIRFVNKASGRRYIIFLKDKDTAIEGYYAIGCMVKSTQ